MPAKVFDKRGNVPITIPSSSCIIRSRRQQVCCVNPEWPRRRALDHLARMLKGVPSPICWSHEWRGRPGCRSPPTRTKAVHGQFLLLRPVIMRGRLACGHRVSPHGRTVSFVSWRWHPEQREGWSGRQLLCFLQSHASVSRGSYVGNACERPPASVDPTAEVSTSPKVQAKFCLQLKPGLSPDFVHRVHGSRSNANAPDNVWLTPARSRLNRPQICKFSYFFQRVAANWWARCRFPRSDNSPSLFT